MFEFQDVVQDPNTIPEDYKELYKTQEDGTAALLKDDPKITGAIKAIGGLRGSLAASRKEAADYKGQRADLSPLAEYGETIEGIASNMAAKLEEMQVEVAKGSKAKVDVEQIKADLEKAFATKAESAEKRNKGLQAQLYDEIVTKEAVQAIAAAKGDAALLMPLVKGQVVVLEEDGKTNAFVVDDDGNRRYGESGNPMSVGELVSVLKGKHPRAFESERKTGTGKPSDASNRLAGKPGDGQEKLSTQKIADGITARQTG